MAKTQTKSKSSEVLMRDITKKLAAYKDAKEVQNLLSFIKKNSVEIDKKNNFNFNQLVKDRKCLKFFHMTNEDFKAYLKTKNDVEIELFKYAQTLSPERKKYIEEISAKAKDSAKATRAKKQTNNEDKIEDLLKDIN